MIPHASLDGTFGKKKGKRQPGFFFFSPSTFSESLLLPMQFHADTSSLRCRSPGIFIWPQQHVYGLSGGVLLCKDPCCLFLYFLTSRQTRCFSSRVSAIGFSTVFTFTFHSSAELYNTCTWLQPTPPSRNSFRPTCVVCPALSSSAAVLTSPSFLAVSLFSSVIKPHPFGTGTL